ncbi:unnamed protein product [Rotaria sordida]|uniref:Uncharacterized protein n=2 Tax=Rotaria sordida TaxID=392033 RepID=A0A819H2I8_9BILA|nr:unnamed protein product [Rotaria sordida]
MLCSCEVILMDGTFKTCSIIFSQQFNWYGALRQKEPKKFMKKNFQSFKKKSTDFGLKFEPQYAYLDFEVGTINALEKITGLTSMYENNEKVKIWLKSLMALPLIMNNAVDSSIELLIENVPSSDKLLIEFLEYFKNQWVTRIPIKYWNLGLIHLRCNNSVEGTVCFEGTIIVEMLCIIFIVILGYNNRLQYRFGVHP